MQKRPHGDGSGGTELDIEAVKGSSFDHGLPWLYRFLPFRYRGGC